MHGILLLDKPLKLTSNDALQRAKRIFRLKKAGHTGSLDPLATGMLPICFGDATKFSQFLLESDKQYVVTATLGIQTTTGDAEGDVIARASAAGITLEKIQKSLESFKGSIQQIPPMHSAVKIDGKPLYELARKGIEIERKPRTVQIHELVLHDFQADKLILDVRCSKGTYIRTLIEDIGKALGCGAFVSELRRVAVVPYEQETMYSLDDLMNIFRQDSYAGLTRLLLPVDTTLKSLPLVRLITSSAYYFRTGHPVLVSQLPSQGLVRVYDPDDKFLGVGEVLADGRLSPKRLVALQ